MFYNFENFICCDEVVKEFGFGIVDCGFLSLTGLACSRRTAVGNSSDRKIPNPKSQILNRGFVFSQKSI